MAYRSLDEFLIRLEQSKKLIVSDHPLDTTIPLTMQRIFKQHEGAAVQFTLAKSNAISVVMNLFSTEQQMAWALGVDSLSELTDRTREVVDLEGMTTFGALLNRFSALLPVLRSISSPSRRLSNAPVQSIRYVDDICLDVIPFLQFVDADTHASLLPVTAIISDPKTGDTVYHLTEIVRLDAISIGVDISRLRWHGTEHPDVALVLGGDPSIIWCTLLELPMALNPYWLAAWVRKKAVPMTASLTNGLAIPAEADMVIEGCLDMSDIRSDIVLHTSDGYPRSGMSFAAMQVAGMSHHEHAIVPAIPASAHRRDFAMMSKAATYVVKPLLQSMIPSLGDIHLPVMGSGHDVIVASCHRMTRGSIRRLMYGLWGMNGLASARVVIVVDAHVDIRNFDAVACALAAHVDLSRDIIQVDGEIYLDTGQGGATDFGGKIGIDATRKPEQVNTNEVNWREYLVVRSIDDSLEVPDRSSKTLAVQVDRDVPRDDLYRVASHVMRTVDFVRDVEVIPNETDNGVVRVSAVREGRDFLPRLSISDV